MKAKMMKRDPEIRTMWKQKWGWHNRGNVWDKLATDWAGKEEWMIERKVKSTLVDKYRFVTSALDSVKLSTVHRRKLVEGKGKKIKEKTPRDLGPADTTHARMDRQHNYVETVMWHVNGSMVKILWGRSTEEDLAKCKRPCTQGGEGRLPIRF